MLINTYTYIESKSKFTAYYYDIKSKDEFNLIYLNLKKENKNARHIPYACILSNTAFKSDDKEPSGSSANPIYNALLRNNLQNKAIFVVRIFGGTKLGIGGLSRAYSKVANEVIRPTL
jgi:putative IMPACT (imprinted ancient) family translation regulator